MARQLADVECEVVHSTEAAVKLRSDKGEAWVPRKAVEIDDDDPDNIVVTMPMSMAVEKGLV